LGIGIRIGIWIRGDIGNLGFFCVGFFVGFEERTDSRPTGCARVRARILACL